jgi:cell division septum initiation protein DivIVA
MRIYTLAVFVFLFFNPSFCMDPHPFNTKHLYYIQQEVADELESCIQEYQNLLSCTDEEKDNLETELSSLREHIEYLKKILKGSFPYERTITETERKFDREETKRYRLTKNSSKRIYRSLKQLCTHS